MEDTIYQTWDCECGRKFQVTAGEGIISIEVVDDEIVEGGEFNSDDDE